MKLIFFLFLSVTLNICIAQNKDGKKMKKQTSKNNPLICDPVEGVCGDSNTVTSQNLTVQEFRKPIKAIYFTDPICSSCWGIEPQLRKLKLEYGEFVDIVYHMGGLLPDWSYNSGGISKPSDVAGHWDEVSEHYDMPIDGDIWLEDPLPSSYPPSIAFKAAQIQDKEKAILFLRELREMVFLRKKNITKWVYIAAAARKAGLDVTNLEADYNGQAKDMFKGDLNLAKQYGVRGFPTLIFTNKDKGSVLVYGSKPYETYEEALLNLLPSAAKSGYSRDWKALFAKYSSLTAKEFSTLSGIPRIESEKVLNELVEKGILKKLTIKNGSIWTLIK